MRILFLEKSSVWIHAFPNGFREAGHQVMISGPLSFHNILDMISSFRPHFAVSIGWGTEQTEQKQLWIRDHLYAAGVPLIYWAVEDPAYTEAWSLPLIRRMQPDFVFTISKSALNEYKKLGIQSAYMDFGHHENVHYTAAPSEQYSHSVAVVAGAYPHVFEKYPEHYRLRSLRTLISPLLQANIKIDFYGNDWDKMGPYLGCEIPTDWIHGHLPYTEANKVYSSSKIMIGLQNYPMQLTQRTYEILGSGGFVLTSDTPEIRRLFTPGKDLIASSSPEETILLVRYYLEHADERNRIRRQGKLAVQNDTYRHRAEYVIKVLVEQGVLQADPVGPPTDGEIFYYMDYSLDEYELHKVSKGDTLWGISQKYNVSVKEIKTLNGLTSDIITIDQCLRIKKKQNLTTEAREDGEFYALPTFMTQSDVLELLNKAAHQVGVDPPLLYAIAYAESDVGRNAGMSRAGAYGIMQLMRETARELGVDRTDPWQNVLGGAMYIQKKLKEFKGDIPKALAAYNCGANNVSTAVRDHGPGWLAHLPEETENYVAKIIMVIHKENGTPG